MPSQGRSWICLHSRSALGVAPAMATVLRFFPVAHRVRRTVRPSTRQPQRATGAPMNQPNEITREKWVEVLVAKRKNASDAAVIIHEKSTGLASATKCSARRGRSEERRV